MAILRDSRAAVGHFDHIAEAANAYQNHVLYAPHHRKNGASFDAVGGVPRRVSFVPGADGECLMRICQPKVGSSGPRTELSLKYEAITVERTFLVAFSLPADGPDRWVPDDRSYATICQWHTKAMPLGARQPPLEVAVQNDSQGIGLTLRIAHDHGSGQGGTPQAGGVKATIEPFLLGYLVPGQRYLVAIKARAAGRADDYVQAWLNGVQQVDYRGFAGYPNGLNNYFKFGSYSYMLPSSPQLARVVYFHGVLVGDHAETAESLSQAFLQAPPADPGAAASLAVAALGSNLQALPRRATVTPLINLMGAGLTAFAYTGRLRGAWSAATRYAIGDSVVPAAPVGVTAYLPHGLKFVCERAGLSGTTAPAWPAQQHGQLDDGECGWRAERREGYDNAPRIYAPGELGFDPLGLLSSMTWHLLQGRAAAARWVLLAFGPAEAAIGASQADIAAATRMLAQYIARHDARPMVCV